jgi:hypothetical protein
MLFSSSFSAQIDDGPAAKWPTGSPGPDQSGLPDGFLLTPQNPGAPPLNVFWQIIVKRATGFRRYRYAI